MTFRTPLLLVSALLLQACATRETIIAPKKTLAVVKPVEKIQLPRIDLNIGEKELLDSYRELVKIIPPGKGSGRELRRLADLELEASIQKRLSNSATMIAEGDQSSFNAIMHYNDYLKHYPGHPQNDQVLYQLARAYALDSNPYGAAPVMDRLVREYPQSEHIPEIQFRRGEHLFVEKDYLQAAQAYADIVNNHSRSIYFDKALYKLGWSHLKLEDYQKSLESFIQLLDQHYRRRQLRRFELSENINDHDRETIEDVLRATGICFSYMEQSDPIGRFFATRNKREYEPLLYSRLGDAYLSKERISDAIRTYIALGERFPLSPHAAELHDRAIGVLASAGFTSELLNQKKQFIQRYGGSTEFWQKLRDKDRIALQPVLTRHMYDISTHYHALARSSGRQADFQTAASHYRTLITEFPKDPKVHHVNFLMAEALNDGGQLERAIAEYDKTAYDYFNHNNSAEAAYGGLTARLELRRRQGTENSPELDNEIILASIRFYDSFPSDSRAPLVLLKATEMLYDAERHDEALLHARKLTGAEIGDADSRHNARIILAHSLYKLERYPDAEAAYQSTLDNAPATHRVKTGELRDNLALSIFRQAEQARAEGRHADAAENFRRIGQKVPEWPNRDSAEYDAATEYLKIKAWPQAVEVLLSMRQEFPKRHKWKRGISEKLTLAYAELERFGDAGREMLNLGQQLKGEQRAEVLEAAAELFDKGGETEKTIELYESLVASYPARFPQVIEFSQRSADYYQSRENLKARDKWLKKVIEADARAGTNRSDRTRLLAARAELTLAEPHFEQYRNVALSVPLERSLKQKKKLMQNALRAYSEAARYQVAEVSSQATFRIGEIYRDFAGALLQSERPPDLNTEELEEYNYLLEEQAYPFEEKAIEIHEKNIQRIAASGAWDDAVRGSLKALSELLPFRYAKSEIVERFSDVRP